MVNKIRPFAYAVIMEKTAQLLLHRFIASYRPDKNLKVGGVLFYIRKDIPSRLLNIKSKTAIEPISVETNLRKRMWFLNCSYKPNKKFISNHLECLNRIMDEFSENYDNVIFLGDFNSCINDNTMTSFFSLNDVTSLIVTKNMLQKSRQTKMHRFNITDHPSNYFQQNNVLETGLYDFHMIVVTELKWDFKN